MGFSDIFFIVDFDEIAEELKIGLAAVRMDSKPS